MLKLFKQYYPIRNIFFFVGESIFIVLSIMLATWVISGFSFALLSETYLPKVVLVGLVLQTCLYYNDLYEFKVSKTFKELGLRFLEALGAAAILLALIFFQFRPISSMDQRAWVLSIFAKAQGWKALCREVAMNAACAQERRT